MTDRYFSSVDFPDPRKLTWTEGLVAVGGIVDVGTLYHAYRKGIFPWPQEGLPMLWFCPDQRGILFFSDVKPARRLRQILANKDGLRFTRNQAFTEVITACQKQPRTGQAGTWILPEMLEAYVHFHEAGFAHSFEVWRGDQLIGGLYGVLVDGVFSGESMFHQESNAAKRALAFAIEELTEQGIRWMDTQMVTPVVESFGGRLISRDEYLKLLRLVHV